MTADDWVDYYIEEAKRDHHRIASRRRIAGCPHVESKTCDGECRDCVAAQEARARVEACYAALAAKRVARREFTSVCPACGKGYQSEHGQPWTCPDCRTEHTAMWGWERGE